VDKEQKYKKKRKNACKAKTSRKIIFVQRDKNSHVKRLKKKVQGDKNPPSPHHFAYG